MATHNHRTPTQDACAVGDAGRYRVSDAPRAPAASAALGIYAGNPSPPPLSPAGIDAGSGEILSTAKDLRSARAERFILKAMAGRLLPRGSRTSKCMRWRVPNLDMQVVFSPAYQRANYQGLQVCASPWVCPVCGTKIAERRRVEVACAIAAAKALGLTVCLLTLTVPHGLGDDLAELVAQVLKAYSKLFTGKAGAKLRERIGLEGTIRAMEVTHGLNGWHPHFHVLLFLGRGKHVTPEQAHAEIAPRWQRVCESVGLPTPSLDRGCRVDGGEQASGYVTKGSTWGIESELTRGQSKVSRSRKGSTPFDLLRRYADGDKQAGALFAKYAEVFEGKRQLVWSDGLKRRLAVSETADDELANLADDAPTRRLAVLSDDEWCAIYKARLESVVLDLAEVAPDRLAEFIRAIPARFPPDRASPATGGRLDPAPPSDHQQ